ncbi:MAG: methylmalonyl-CoA mutase family protein, partial [Solirubrobacteraceae bacterium]
YHQRYSNGQDVVVGVNKYVTEDIEVPDVLKVDQASEDAQVERLKKFKADRDQELVDRRLEELREASRGTENLLPPLREALRDHCTLGEVCGAMRDVFGEYQPDT